MKNLLMIGAFGLLGTVQAQETPQPTNQTPPQASAVQDTLPVKSAYDACLTTAGHHTWTALGLNADQMTRVSALQTRYKELMAPKPEPKKADAKKARKSKNKAAAKDRLDTKDQVDRKDAGEEKLAVEDPAKLNAPVGAPEAAVPDRTSVGTDTTMADLDPAPAVPLSVDDELAMILTPEQLELWNKRCASASATGMVQP